MNGWIKHIQMNIALESTKGAEDTSSPTQALEYPVYKRRAANCMGRNEVFSETNASPNSVYIYYVAIYV